MKRLCICVVALTIAASISLGGWQRQNGKTSWINAPSVGTAWGRDSNKDVYVLRQLPVYPDTVHYVSGAATNVTPSYGFWTVDSDGNVYPNTTTSDYLNKSNQMARYDIEWDVDSDGNLYPKD